MAYYNQKLIISGNVVEYYQYENAVCHGFIGIRRKGRSNSSHTSEEIKKANRAKVAQRARTTVRRYANANPQLNKFLTLTFADNVTDIKYARYEFDKFVKRVKTIFPAFLYIAVIEFQDRGAIHFHLLCNMPYVNVNEFAKVWRYGFIRLNKLDNVDNVGAYITKYMSKNNIDERLIGKKCYTMSKGLNEPKEFTKSADIDEVLQNLDSVVRSRTSEFDCEHYGKVTYTQVVCSRLVALPDPFARFMARFKDRLQILDNACPVAPFF